VSGKLEDGKAEAEEARVLLEAKLSQQPNDPATMTRLSWIYLALDRPTDALRVAGRVADAFPIARDALSGPDYAVGLAQIQTRAGQPREAVKVLRHLLSIPAGEAVSLNRLKLDPVWDPIRKDPEFQQLLVGKEHVGP